MWQGVAGHDGIVQQFRARLAAGRLASTYLFVGPHGIGKRLLALKLAQGLLCTENGPQAIDPCGQCEACRLVEAGTHPDLTVVARLENRNRIALEQLIGDREHRNQRGLCHELSMRPLMSDRKVAIIDDADDLQVEAANSLLKTLEEPPPGSLLILIGTSTDQQLPTILSRCQVERFLPLSTADVTAVLRQQGVAERCGDQLERIAAASEGSPSRAIALAEEADDDFRHVLFERLADGEVLPAGLTELILEYVQQAGREAAMRRRRLLDVLGWAASFYRLVMRQAAGVPAVAGQPRLAGLVQQVCEDRRIDTQRAAALIEACLDAIEHAERNVHPTTLVEAWAERIVRLGAAIAARSPGS